MARHYRHKAIHIRSVPYSFQCEHCMKDSGPLTAIISGNQKEYISSSNALTEQQKARLNGDAHESLKNEMRTIYTNAAEKQIFPLTFKDECPHCREPQSWGASGTKSGIEATLLIILLVGLLVGLGICFIIDFKRMTYSLVIKRASMLALDVVSLYIVARAISKKKRADAKRQKNLPVIDWAAAQDLLSES